MVTQSPDKATAVVTKVKMLLGDPIVPMLERESQALDAAFDNTLIRYWTAFPLIYQDYINISITGSYTRKYADVINSALVGQSDLVKSQAFYVGPVRISEMSRAIQYSNLDAYLLNIPFGTPPRLGSQGLGSDAYSGPLNVYKIIQEQSEQKYLTGNVEYVFDQLNQQLVFNIPVFFGQVSIHHGIGFLDKQLSMLPWNHVLLFAEMLGFEFLTGVISAREALKLNTDYQIDTNYLKELRRDLWESFMPQVEAYCQSVVMWS